MKACTKIGFKIEDEVFALERQLAVERKVVEIL